MIFHFEEITRGDTTHSARLWAIRTDHGYYYLFALFARESVYMQLFDEDRKVCEVSGSLNLLPHSRKEGHAVLEKMLKELAKRASESQQIDLRDTLDEIGRRITTPPRED